MVLSKWSPGIISSPKTLSTLHPSGSSDRGSSSQRSRTASPTLPKSPENERVLSSKKKKTKHDNNKTDQARITNARTCYEKKYETPRFSPLHPVRREGSDVSQLRDCQRQKKFESISGRPPRRCGPPNKLWVRNSTRTINLRPALDWPTRNQMGRRMVWMASIWLYGGFDWRRGKCAQRCPDALWTRPRERRQTLWCYGC